MFTKDERLNKLLPEIEKSIRESFGEKVNKIILFGSYARGDYNEESDVDILVVVDDENLSYYRKKRVKTITDFLKDHNILLSIRIVQENNFITYKNHSPFILNIVNEGKVLYGWKNRKFS